MIQFNEAELKSEMEEQVKVGMKTIILSSLRNVVKQTVNKELDKIFDRIDIDDFTLEEMQSAIFQAELAKRIQDVMK